MSQSTYVCWYRREPIGYPEWIPLVRRTLELWQPDELESVYERGWEDRSWEENQLFLNCHIDDVERVVKSFDSNNYSSDPILERVPIDRFLSTARADRGYYVTYYKVQDRGFGERVIRLPIPESVGGNVFPTAPSISIGNHDVVHLDLDQYIARASFSFELSSYGTPPYPDEWERIYFGSEPVKELEAKLIEIWGPLERCWYTSS